MLMFQQIHNVSLIAKIFHQWRLLSLMSRPKVLRKLSPMAKTQLICCGCETGFITKEKLTKMMKSTGKNPKAEVWEVLIDVDVDGNGGIYILKPFSYNEDQSTNLDK
ncbi:hypothetical protein HA466_0014810 [Hirschfeldia incana]|nr:hypothetical protein HA466_0014810 [Hirschfeldia incana]KAJ0265137.1 hypothetical protein HA466_0014810 [Hirschfeldia incana]